MANKSHIIAQIAKELKETLRGRGNLTPEDEKYVVENLDSITDQRLKECVGQLLGWDDVQRGKLETAMSIFIELCKISSASKLATAAKNAEVRFYLKNMVVEEVAKRVDVVYSHEGELNGKTP